MTDKLDDAVIGKQLHVGDPRMPPMALGGVGPTAIDGAAYMMGPVQMGQTAVFPWPAATLMVGPSVNPPPPMIPGALCSGVHNPYSLGVMGPSAFLGKLDTNDSIGVGQHLFAQGHVFSNCGGHVLAAKKNFDISHPTKEGGRLSHVCVEAPTADVYIRGKLDGSNIIQIPEYWKGLVDYDTITVNLTPLGRSDTSLHVKEIHEDKIIVSSDHLVQVKCFYHVYGERIDVEKNIPEYEGESPKDYPGDLSQASIVGDHYDVREG